MMTLRYWGVYPIWRNRRQDLKAAQFSQQTPEPRASRVFCAENRFSKNVVFGHFNLTREVPDYGNEQAGFYVR